MNYKVVHVLKNHDITEIYIFSTFTQKYQGYPVFLMEKVII